MINRSLKRFSPYVWIIVAISLSPIKFAHAYLDPGTGSYVIQIVIGVVFGAAYTIKSYGASIVQKFRAWRTKK